LIARICHSSYGMRASFVADPWHVTVGAGPEPTNANRLRQPSTILRLTAEHSPGGAYPANVAAYISGVFRGTIAATDHIPAGLHLYLP
jgi:hypothetical protein